MPDLKDFINDKPEDERIRKWREERHRVAEVEKAERIRRRDDVRARVISFGRCSGLEWFAWCPS